MKKIARRIAAAFALFVLAGSDAGHAFDILPEFGGLDAAEAESLDQPRLLDSEYQSDVFSYMPDLEADAEFFSRPAGLELALGSLSAKQFLHYQRARARKDLERSLEFRFTHFIQRDLEEDRERNVLELIAKTKATEAVPAKVGLSVYGMPSREKEDIDLGFALLFWPEPGREIRLFHTWIDVVREERAQADARFVSSENPNSLGVSSRHITETEYATFGFRRDFPGVWRFPRAGRDYSHARTLIWTERRQRLLRSGISVETRVQWDRKNEAISPAPGGGGTTAAEELTSERLQILFAITSAPNERDISLKGGFFHVGRRWSQANREQASHTNWLPYVSAQFLGKKRAGGRDRIELGYETTFFNGEGDGGFFNRGAEYDAVEQRLNLKYEFALLDNARLSFLIGADLDAGQTFEGGQGRFLVFF